MNAQGGHVPAVDISPNSAAQARPRAGEEGLSRLTDATPCQATRPGGASWPSKLLGLDQATASPEQNWTTRFDSWSIGMTSGSSDFIEKLDQIHPRYNETMKLALTPPLADNGKGPLLARHLR